MTCHVDQTIRSVRTTSGFEKTLSPFEKPYLSPNPPSSRTVLKKLEGPGGLDKSPSNITTSETDAELGSDGARSARHVAVEPEGAGRAEQRAFAVGLDHREQAMVFGC